MRGNELLDKMSLIDPAYIEGAEALPRRRRSNFIKRYGAIAACLVLLISVGFGTYAYAAEAKEYNDAVLFFNSNGLPLEGLTRKEIKLVYRDITTETFSYTKTGWVIVNSLTSEQIAGYEIPQDDPTSEDIRNLWNYKNYFAFIPNEKEAGVRYEYRDEEKMDDELGFDVHDRSYIEKYKDDKLVWSVSFTEFQIFGYNIVSDGVIVYGNTDRWSSTQDTFAWIAKVDVNGNVVWKQKVSDEFHIEYVRGILENADGGYSVFTQGDFKYLCLNRYEAEGKKIFHNKTDVSGYGIANITRFGDGYLVQLENYKTNEHTKIVKLDEKGNIERKFSYSSKDVNYHINDMIEFNGKMYLSAHAVPKSEYDIGFSRRDISNVLDYLDKNDIWKISSEELTPLVRDNYTAVLLVCDPNVGTPQEFYSVKGSLGGKLALSESGELLWNVESIADTYYSPYTSSFTIGGTCYVYRYTFDGNGKLTEQKKLDITVGFRR